MVTVKMLPTYETLKSNILNLYREIESVEPRYIYDGARWYETANRLAFEIAITADTTLSQVAACIALLSPQKSWSDNIEDARAVVGCYARHGQVTRALVSEILGRGIFSPDKDLAACERVLRDNVTITGLKRIAFVTNIVFPERVRVVTVDSHAVRIAIANVDDSGTIPDSKYDLVASAYRDVADSLSIAPMHLQAITWLYWRDARVKSSGRRHYNVVAESVTRGYIVR